MPDSFATKPVAQWTREDAEAAARSGLPTTYDVARKMLEDHDHLQEGTLWVGQRASGTLSTEQLNGIKQGFIPDPLLEEIRENRTNGLLQREADISFDPRQEPDEGAETGEQEERADRLLRVLAAWWDRKKFWPTVRRAFGRTAYSGRSDLRIWVAPANLRQAERDLRETMLGQAPRTVLPTNLSLEEALDVVEVGDPLPDAAAHYILPATQRPVAVYLDRTDPSKPFAEVYSVENGQTVLRVLSGGQTQENPMDLGGRLPLVEMQVPPIVNDPVIKNQALLNFENTVLNAVLESAGFPERTFTNAEPPGIWLAYAPTDSPPLEEDTIAGVKMWKHRVPWMFGFRKVTELMGIKSKVLDAQGREIEQYETPSVTYKEPTSPDYVKSGKQETRSRLYRMCRQGHLATDSTAEASGDAYIQARAQFEADLLGCKGPLEGMVRDALETVLAFAALMSDEAKALLDEFRCVVNLHVTSGPIKADEARLAVELRDKRAISTQTMMARLGVEDPVAELAAIEEDPLYWAEYWAKIAPALSTITGLQGATMTAEGAAFLLRLSSEVQAVLRTGIPPAPEQPAVPTVPTVPRLEQVA